jgi:uncharacterized membrane protein YozB (DUF420 family)
MTKPSPAVIRRIYAAILSISIILAAVCLMAACLSLYDSGNGAFSREAVAAAFSPISVPVYACLFLILLGFLVHRLFPGDDKRNTAEKSNRLTLQRLHRKTDLSACDEDLRRSVYLEQIRRKKHLAVAISLISAVFLVFLLYVLTGDRFLLPDITSSMKQAMLVLLPGLAVAFGYSIFAHYQIEKSMTREIELMKQAAKEAPAKASPSPAPSHINLLRTVLLLAAIILLVVGYFTGGTGDVLTKAINICTECVGLG